MPQNQTVVFIVRVSVLIYPSSERTPRRSLLFMRGASSLATNFDSMSVDGVLQGQRDP